MPCGTLTGMKKVNDEDFIEAYVSSHTREEVARKTGLTRASVTDRAAALRKKLKIKLALFSKPRQSQQGAAWLAADNLLAAVDAPECAERLLNDEVSSGICTKTIALLNLVGSLEEALDLIRRD